MINTAQHAGDIGILQTASTKCNSLVQQAQTVTHTTVCCTGDPHDGGFLSLYRFRLQDFFQVSGYLPG